jgi:glycosyltransferase involved in cell wall biosynthesis
MLIPGYFPLVGGAEIQLSGLLQRINRDRFAPFVLTRRVEGTSPAGMDGYTPVTRLSAPLGAGSFFFPALGFLWRKRKEYEAIHVFSVDSPSVAAAVIKRLYPGKKLVLRISGFGNGSAFDRVTRTRLGRARLRFLLNKADAVTAPPPHAMSVLKKMGVPEAKIVGIPDGVDADCFDPAGEELKRVLKRSFGIAEDAFVGIVVASPIVRKVVMSVLKAWRRVIATHPNSALIVAGGGPEGPRLAEYAEANFPGRSVIFTGNTSRDEVTRLLKTADAFVDYSRSEGVSGTILEAMSSGLPVVAVRRPGIDQLVDHSRTGFLFDADCPADGADYMMRLAEDRALIEKMSDAVRAVVDSRYSFESIARDVEKLYVGERVTRREPAPVPAPRKIAPVSQTAAPSPPAADVKEETPPVPELVPVVPSAPQTSSDPSTDPTPAQQDTPHTPPTSETSLASEISPDPAPERQTSTSPPPDREIPAPDKPRRSKRKRHKKRRGKNRSQ